MWARWLAALLLGLPLAVGAIGLLAVHAPGDPHRTTLAWLLLVFPAWMAAMTIAFAARTPLRAWLWMGGATLACHCLIHATRLAGGLPGAGA